jgi:DNA modification methylase
MIMADFRPRVPIRASDTCILPVSPPSLHHAREHNRKKRRKLAKLLERYGQITPIIVDQDHVIVDGHAVHATLKGLGCREIMAVVVSNCGPAEIRALRLALNRIAQDANWNEEHLRREFRELLALGFELDLTGFDQVEIDMTLDLDPSIPGGIEEEPAASLEPASEPPVLTAGDIFRTGRHQVGCGDARDSQLLASLVGTRAVSVVFTDPPYNLDIAGFVSGLGRTRHREFAMGSGEMSKEEFLEFLAESIAALISHLADGAILYVCMDWRHMAELLEAARRNGLELKNLCVWCKTNAGNGTFYRSQHELVFVFKHGSGAHQNHFELGQHGRIRSNVWTYAGVNTFGKERMELLGAHPTVKPWKMIADALLDVSHQRDLVIDPFLGSGSTLIAAERTGRTCIGIDMDPGYVEVAIRRWQKETGRDAVHVPTGQTFDEYVQSKRTESLAQTTTDAQIGGNGKATMAADDSHG